MVFITLPGALGCDDTLTFLAMTYGLNGSISADNFEPLVLGCGQVSAELACDIDLSKWSIV